MGKQAAATAEFRMQLKLARPVPKERADKLVRAVASKVGEALIVGNAYGPGTPVDTGFARGSWYATLGEADPDRNTSEPNPDAGRASLENAAQVQMAAAIAGAGGGDVINFVNDAAYIERLNNGYSAQAPAGMTDSVVASWSTIVATEAARLGIAATGSV